MSNMLKMKRPTRFAAMLVALFYFWLSAATGFQHTHHLGDETEGAPAIRFSTGSASAISISQTASSQNRLSSATKVALPVRCLACEWQAANVSAALAPVRFVFAYSPHTDIHIAAPRAPSVFACFASSRGPPRA